MSNAYLIGSDILSAPPLVDCAARDRRFARRETVVGGPPDNYRGNYASDTYYGAGDSVLFYDGTKARYYIANVSVSGETPNASGKWTVSNNVVPTVAMMGYLAGTDLLGAAERELLGYDVPDQSLIAIVTPGTELDEMNKIGAEMWRLDSDINTFKPASSDAAAYAAFKTSWGSFVEEYKAYYESNKGLTARLFGSKMDKIIQYGKTLNTWRDKFEKYHSASGGLAVASSPAPLAREEKTLVDQFLGKGGASTATTAIKWTAVAAGSIAGAVLLGKGLSIALEVVKARRLRAGA